ncbi:hypothetical protein GGR54DRAFT_587492 [Hypoxylon sp. NC1633]|nr:hypothetical protein GGR54DRAFT_587492 [Hypoxylon sp. NC1633]
MDWPSAETCFNDNDYDNFKYEPRSFKIIKKLQSDKTPTCWDIDSPRCLTDWVKKVRKPVQCIHQLTFHSMSPQ